MKLISDFKNNVSETFWLFTWSLLIKSNFYMAQGHAKTLNSKSISLLAPHKFLWRHAESAMLVLHIEVKEVVTHGVSPYNP